MPAIRVDNATKLFDGRTVINNLSFSIDEGQNFGILGPNGAGKTTIINMLMGLISPTSGRITILGMDIKNNIEKIRQIVALVPQTISIYDSLTVYENIEFFGNLYPGKKLHERINQLMNIFLLQDKKHIISAKLSGGYQRRVSIACALIAEPRIVFLDEPLTGIDITTNKIILDYLKKQSNVTIIYTTHSIQEAENLCDQVLFLHNGEKILEGSPKNIIKNFSTTFGERIIIELDHEINASDLQNKIQNAGHNIKNFTFIGKQLSFTRLGSDRNIIDMMQLLDSIKSNIVHLDIRKLTLEEIFNFVVQNHETIAGSH